MPPGLGIRANHGPKIPLLSVTGVHAVPMMRLARQMSTDLKSVRALRWWGTPLGDRGSFGSNQPPPASVNRIGDSCWVPG